MVFRLSAECSAFELEKDFEIGAICGNCTRMNSLEVSQVSCYLKIAKCGMGVLAHKPRNSPEAQNFQNQMEWTSRGLALSRVKLFG